MNTTRAISWNHPLTRLDVVGSVLSTLCAIHCLAMPLVAGLLPVLGLGFLGDPAFDQAACLAMMALAAVWPGAGLPNPSPLVAAGLAGCRRGAHGRHAVRLRPGVLYKVMLCRSRELGSGTCHVYGRGSHRRRASPEPPFPPRLRAGRRTARPAWSRFPPKPPKHRRRQIS